MNRHRPGLFVGINKPIGKRLDIAVKNKTYDFPRLVDHRTPRVPPVDCRRGNEVKRRTKVESRLFLDKALGQLVGWFSCCASVKAAKRGRVRNLLAAFPVSLHLPKRQAQGER